ncbi:tetratricopeptide repeat (TPR)-like superfamily protein [Actinidia rufa]|uniref:Tetratricopeptide repeat (TPR)-like superfamily protein n=1 Tax=Actinidia rufa TaxID=165716 RepID=A0A7J0F725_9ERIC|nr:tetratricopeptide repeat (TPR)-like superfamily protein [Actinidia rufa]
MRRGRWYLLASSMYAAGGSWVDAARMKWLVKERGEDGDHINLVSEQLHSCMKMDNSHDEAAFERLMQALQSRRMKPIYCKESQSAIGEARSNAELQPSALDHAKAMGHILSTANDQLARKLRAICSIYLSECKFAEEKEYILNSATCKSSAFAFLKLEYLHERGHALAPGRCIFQSFLQAPKPPSWFWRIKESSSKEQWQQVFTHYREMKKAGVQFTDPSLYPPILKACLVLSFKHGQSVHTSLLKQGLVSFSSTGNSMMDFYVKSGTLSSALGVFHCMSGTDSISWNIIIHGDLDHGAPEDGLCLFMDGRVAGFEPNTATLVLVIQACRSLGATHEGLKIHGYLIVSGFGAIVSVQNSLLSMYADIEMDIARKLFDEMYSRDLISWSMMIGGYVLSEEPEVAFQLFREVASKNKIEMDGQIMVNVIKACIHLGKINIGRLKHGFVIRTGLDYDLFVGNSLIDMYSKCHDTESALKVFREIPRRNLVSWNSLLSGFVSNEKYSKALWLFDSMQKAGIETDEVTLANLLQTCKHLLVPIHGKSIHSIIIRRVMKLMNWVHRGMPNEAIAVFQEMSQAQNKPDAITLLNLLEACSVYAELKRSKSVHGIAIRWCLTADVVVGTAILDMYSKCGAIEASERVFDQLPQRNIVSWSAMIAAYGMNGLPCQALALLRQMKAHGLKPNTVTALSVLSACSHGGLINEGLLFFQELVEDHTELRLEHYSCVVDLLARAGNLDSAMELIKKMPSGLNPGASAWGALLSACRSCGNSELGVDAVSHILELEPSSSAGYLLASSMYAAGGSWVDAARMRWLVKERGVRMVTAYSLVHVNNNACKFAAGDKHRPFSSEINLVSEQLHWCMKMDNSHDEAVFEQ